MKVTSILPKFTVHCRGVNGVVAIVGAGVVVVVVARTNNSRLHTKCC